MIRLFYYQNLNLGDQLSFYIVKKLSEKEIVYCNPFSFYRYLRNHLSAIKHILKGHKNRIPILCAFSREKVLIAVGSLIEHSTNNCVVWGTGMAQKEKVPMGGEFLITRGYESKKLLEDCGFTVISRSAGDPALLMPKIFCPIVRKIKGKIGIVPHVSEFSEVQNYFCGKEKFELIDFRTKDVEGTITQLLSCEFVYSSSLHGIILCHAYGINCIRFKNNEIGGGDFKFKDYFSSVEIPYYEPLSINNVLELIQPKHILQLPDKSLIVGIQNELLRLAPFTVKPDYLNDTY